MLSRVVRQTPPPPKAFPKEFEAVGPLVKAAPGPYQPGVQHEIIVKAPPSDTNWMPKCYTANLGCVF